MHGLEGCPSRPFLFDGCSGGRLYAALPCGVQMLLVVVFGRGRGICPAVSLVRGPGMSIDIRLTDALSRLHRLAHEWLARSSVEEEELWRQEINELESSAVCETSELKRSEIESALRNYRRLLENRDNCCTNAYSALLFSFGLARLGARGASESLKASAVSALATKDKLHQLLLRAFLYRIEQAQDGNPCNGGLPPALLPLSSKPDNLQVEETITRYKVEQARNKLRILEPAEQVRPFRDAIRKWSGDKRPIHLLYDIAEPKQLEAEIRQLLDKSHEIPDVLQILGAALDLLPRLAPSFARALLERTQSFLAEVPPIGDLCGRVRQCRRSREELSRRHCSQASEAHDREFKDLTDLRERVAVMDIVARRAADGSDPALLRKVIAVLLQMVDAQRGDDFLQAIPILAGQCLLSLRRLGLRNDLEALLHRLSDLIRDRTNPALLRGKGEELRVRNLQLMLNVAAGWVSLGRIELATPTIDETRSYLFEPPPGRLPGFIAGTAYRYVATVALCPADQALGAFDELFSRIGPLPDSLTTNSHLSLVRLQLIDAVVRAVVHLAYPDDMVDDYLAVTVN